MSAAPATASGHTSTSRCVSTETRSTRSATSDRIRSRASHVYCLEVVSRDGGTGSGLRRRKRLPTAPAVSPRGGRSQLRRFIPTAGRGTRIGPPGGQRTKERSMGLLLAVLALIIILAILGFAVTKFLLIIAAIVLVLWLLGFVARGAEGARWYRW